MDTFDRKLAAQRKALMTRPKCESNRCEEGTLAVMLGGATCENGHDLRRHLCQPCYDWIWGTPGKPGCSRCAYVDLTSVPATLLEAVHV